MVTGVKPWFSLKNAYLLYVTYFINVTHAYASGRPLFKTYWPKFRFGITGVKRIFFTKNEVTSSIRLTLPVPLAKGAVSSSFFFLLSFSQSASSSTCLIGFLPNLVRSKYGWMATKLMGLKTHPGSFGVTGVKKMILRKTLLLLQITWYGLVTNLSCNGLTLSTKVMGLKIHPGSFGVTGVKNVNYYYLNDWIRRLTD